MLIRFVLPTKNADTGVREGVFGAAYELPDRADIPEKDLQELTALLEWFGSNLKTPRRFNKTTSKGYYRKATKGVSWFKSTADEHVAKLWALTRILAKNGHQPELIKTRKPGYIVYEDEIQVVAEPFSDLRD